MLAGMGFTKMAVIILATLILVGGLGFAAYRWKIRQEMRDEVKSILKQYMPLAEGDDQAEVGTSKGQPVQSV